MNISIILLPSNLRMTIRTSFHNLKVCYLIYLYFYDEIPLSVYSRGVYNLHIFRSDYGTLDV